MLISLRDARRCNMCRRGARAFFDQHGLDWEAFRKDGIPEEQLAATGDALAFKLIEESKEHGR